MNRVFYNDNWEEISENGQVVLCGFYHRYWNPDKTRNQAFDMFSGRILDVKEKKEKGISYFFSSWMKKSVRMSVFVWFHLIRKGLQTIQVLQNWPEDLQTMVGLIR